MPDSFKSKFPTGSQKRSAAEINAVFDRAKGAFAALYIRAWRENRCLEGGIIIAAIAVQADGSVADTQIVHSQFNDLNFEQKIMERIKLLQFAPTDGDGFYVFLYPIRIYPS